MELSSTVFLVGLFPLLLIGCLCFRKNNTLCNALLLFISCIFYIWGGAGFALLLFFVCLLVWTFTKLICSQKNRPVLRRIALFLAIALVSTPLLLTKYTGFLVNTVNSLCGTNISVFAAFFPLGISFYTFQAISLLVDLYTGKIDHKPSFIRVLFYLTFFPTVVSGPITRYNDLFSQINNQKITGENLRVGITRMVIGLSKKMLLANGLSVFADYAFTALEKGNQISAFGLWVGAFAYTMQIYFDFSGYSDMAIGISRILGFRLQENFEHPYIASSIQDFWRRWHVSLSRWFRDYVYIPLGGSRVPALRHVLNLLCVWCFTGIWHGANWTFILWGLFYFVLLVFEKYGGKVAKVLNGRVLGHIYTLFFVNLLWVFFRSASVGNAFRYIGGMFGYATCGNPIEIRFLRAIPFLVLCAVLCLPVLKVTDRWKGKGWYRLVETAVLVLLLTLSLGAVVNERYAPFIYGGF